MSRQPARTSASFYSRGGQSLENQNAVEALRILQQLGGQIDLVIADVQMPWDMDGTDLAHSIKNSFRTLSVSVISDDHDGAPAGITFVQKPFTPDTILKAVDTAGSHPGVANWPGAGYWGRSRSYRSQSGIVPLRTDCALEGIPKFTMARHIASRARGVQRVPCPISSAPHLRTSSLLRRQTSQAAL